MKEVKKDVVEAQAEMSEVGVLEGFASRLRKSAESLDKMQVQFDDRKQKLVERYNKIVDRYGVVKESLIERSEETRKQLKIVRGKIDELRVQIALGRSESVEAFHKIRRRSLMLINEIESSLRANKFLQKSYSVLLEMLAKLKEQLIKMKDNVPALREKVSKAYEDTSKKVVEVIDSMRKKPERTRFEVFQDEMQLAFGHFRKALSRG